MKTLSTTSLTELLTLIKNNFFRKSEAQAATVLSIDNVPTSGSNNLVSSGGVYNALNALSEDVEIYVSASGDDGNAGDYSHPLKTVNAALTKIPKNLNGHTASVLIKDNITSGKIYITGFYAGTLRVVGNGGTRTISFTTISYVGEEGCIYVSNCTAAIEINSIAISNTTTSAGISVRACTNVAVRFVTLAFSGSSKEWDTDAIHVSTLGTVMNTWEVSISGNWSNGVAINGGMAYVGNTYFSDMNTTAMAANGGAAFSSGCTFTSVAAQYWAGSGGRIYVGSQTNVPNY